MKFKDFVCLEALSADIKAEDKEGVIREMASKLLAAGSIAEDQYESIVKAIMNREELGSTGIGHGIAVPHTKHPSVDSLVGAVGVSQTGLDFASLDGEPVYLFFLLVSPPDRPGDHLRALESITRQLRQETFRDFLKQSQTEDAIRELLEEADNNQFE